MPDVRCEDDRCSWCTSTTDSGSSWTAQASSAGVTVTSTSTSRALSACSSPTSVSAENCLSQRGGTSTDSLRVEVGLLDVGDQELAGLLGDDQPAALLAA